MKSLFDKAMHFLGWLCVSAALSAAVAPSAIGAIRLDPVLQGLSSPVYITNAHDDSNRLFIVEQAGRIKVLAPGASTPTLFLDISSKVLSGGEQGFLGLAFHPQFGVGGNSRFFVNYTRQPDGATVIAEYQVSANPNVAAPNETVLLTIPQPYTNHNGGMIEFGFDGFLYIGMGDGGSANDPQSHAQNINDLLGKILRIDVDHPADGKLYSSPTGNPYAGATAGSDEIYAVGMRNPYRFSFDRQTGQLYVGDVGQGAFEEVDIVTVGGNYGWRVYEGNNCTGLNSSLCNAANFVAPIAQYGHTGGRCSITGGYVYRGPAGALPAGTYVFGDYCTGEIFSLASGSLGVLLDTSLNVSSFGEDEAGELYVVGLGGTVHRVSSTATTTTVNGAPNPATVGATVTFTATVTGLNPSGNMSFTENNVALAGCSAAALSGSGNSRTASCTVSSLAAGTHSILASYGGDASNAASSSSAFTQTITGGGSSSNSAAFLGSDVATQGNWKGVYGSDGYAIFGDSTSYPAYAQVTPSGKTDYVWNAQPAETRALQRGVAAGRIAGCWYSGGVINIDVNLTDGNSHKVALYLLDWDSTVRSVRVDVLDATTQQVLATQNAAAFNGGVYLKWDLRGHVIIRLTNTGSSNTVISGLFFDSSGGSAPGSTSTALASSSNPAAVGAAVTLTATVAGSNPTGNVGFTDGGAAMASCTAVALTGSGNARTASCTVSSLAAGTHSILASYGGDASNAASSSSAFTQTITGGGSSSNSAAFLGSDVATQGNWKGVYGSDGYAIFGDSTSYPAYAQVTPSGKTDYVWNAQPAETRALQRGVAAGRIAGCWYSGGVINIDVNLTDGNSHKVALYLLDWDSTVRSVRVDVLDATTQQVLATQNAAAFNGGVYLKWDLRGHVIIRLTNTGSSNTVISGLFFDSSGGSAPGSTSTALASSSNPAAVGAAVTLTATVAGSNPTGNVGFTDGGAAMASCTAVALTGSGNARTAACTTSSLVAGTHSIVASYGGDAGNAASSSSVFTQTITGGGSSSNSAAFLGSDVATQGNWKGVYGSDGYAIFGDSTSYPAYAQVTPSGKTDYVWNAQPAETRALQRGVAAGRIAGCWYSGGVINIDVNLTDGNSHKVALYLLDWDSTARSVRVDVLDATTQQVLATQNAAAFNGGVYLKWDLRGHVIIRLTNTGSSNTVISGLFFDSSGVSPPTSTLSVSGTVSADGQPLTGVTFTTTGALACSASDGAGHYTCTAPEGGSGTVTPSLSGYSFAPTSRSYSALGANQTAQDYPGTGIATPPVAQSALAQAAAAMPVGTWAEFATGDLQAVIAQGCSSASMIPFTGSMPWDAVHRQIHIVGSDHRNCDRGPSFYNRYDADSNDWSTVMRTPLGSHGYQHTATDSEGNVYLLSVPNSAIYKWNGSDFVLFSALPIGTANDVALAMVHWSGAGFGAKGSLIVYHAGYGWLYLLDLVTGQWTGMNGGISPTGYHGVSAYSAKKNVMVYGGGNTYQGVSSKEVWRLNADGSKTRMPDAPLAVGINHGMVPIGDSRSGNFLFLGFAQLWELNPDGAGTWTQQTGTRAPPADLRDPATNAAAALVPVDISTYGVTLWIDSIYNRTPIAKVRLYKHAQ